MKPKPPNPMTQSLNVPKTPQRRGQRPSCLSAWRVFDSAGVASLSRCFSPSIHRDSRSIAIRGIKISKERETMMNSDLGQDEERIDSTMQCWSHSDEIGRCPSLLPSLWTVPVSTRSAQGVIQFAERSVDISTVVCVYRYKCHYY